MNAGKNLPLLSFVVPVYNGESTLETCVKSMLDQTDFYSTEIILLDDGSTDSSPELADSYAKIHSNITTIHQNNAGHTAARAAGLANATGEYVFFVDCDDAVAPGTVKFLGDILSDRHPDAVVFGHCEFNEHTEKNIPTGIPEGVYEGERLQRLYHEKLMMDANGNGFPRALWSKVFRRDIAEIALRSVPREIMTGEDMCASIGAFLRVKTLFVSDRILYRYRVSDQSLSRRADENALKRCLFTVGYLRGCADDALKPQLHRLVVQQVYSAGLRVSRSDLTKAQQKQEWNMTLKDPAVAEAVRNARFSERKLRIKRLILRYRLFSLIKLLDR